MSDFPLVSVVIPCFNRANLLIPTIESALQQDYSKIECVVVDAASTDGTVEILKSYGDRIKWVSEPDEGHADAINKGWSMSSGEILAWLNADDIWDVPSAVSRAVDYLRAHPDVDVVYGDCGQIDMEGNRVGMAYLKEWDLEYAVENCDHCIPQPASFIRRSILEKVGWLDKDFYQKKDHELWLRIALQGKIQHIPALVAHERNMRGLSFDGRTAAPSCVQVTRKFFSSPNVPEGLRRKEKRAMSNAYIRGIDYAWEGGRLWSLIVRYLIRSIIVDPSNYRRALVRVKQYAYRSAPEDARLRWLLIIYILLNTPRWAWQLSRSMMRDVFQMPREGAHSSEPEENPICDSNNGLETTP